MSHHGLAFDRSEHNDEELGQVCERVECRRKGKAGDETLAKLIGDEGDDPREPMQARRGAQREGRTEGHGNSRSWPPQPAR